MTLEITPKELSAKLNSQEALFLLDVRTLEEHRAYHLGGYLIPLSELAQRCHEIPIDKPIVVYCRSGHRSQTATEFLLHQGFKDVKNLVGGALAWRQENPIP